MPKAYNHQLSTNLKNELHKYHIKCQINCERVLLGCLYKKKKKRTIVNPWLKLLLLRDKAKHSNSWVLLKITENINKFKHLTKIKTPPPWSNLQSE